MKVLIGCEESQAVCCEFRKLGHEAYSCDILPCSGGHPEWHIQGNVLPLLRQEWDMIIAFPPCTHLAVSGAAHFVKKRADGRQQAGIDFFMEFTRLECPIVAIENPVGIMSRIYRKPDQIIQPYYFGNPESKATCLWLKGLPFLKHTNIVQLPARGYWDNQTASGQNKLTPSPGRAKERSKTYPGIAQAMANQWSNPVNYQLELKGVS